MRKNDSLRHTNANNTIFDEVTLVQMLRIGKITESLHKQVPFRPNMVFELVRASRGYEQKKTHPLRRKFVLCQ